MIKNVWFFQAQHNFDPSHSANSVEHCCKHSNSLHCAIENIKRKMVGRRGGSVHRVWRRGDKRVSFQQRGTISKNRGGGGNRGRIDVSRVARVIMENDDDMAKPSIQAGRARPGS